MTPMFLRIGLFAVYSVSWISLQFTHHSPVQPITTTTTSTTIIATTTTTTTTLVSSNDMAQWSRVAQCETGSNWKFDGPKYSGGLGILVANWYAFGGTEFAPRASMASPEQQIVVAKRIQAHAGVPNFVPDQYGCAGPW